MNDTLETALLRYLEQAYNFELWLAEQEIDDALTTLTDEESK